MSKIITANVPARTVRHGGKSHTFRAYSMSFTQDDEGRWSSAEAGAMTEAEVIDVCRRATNWTELHREHFPMFGFHS